MDCFSSTYKIESCCSRKESPKWFYMVWILFLLYVLCRDNKILCKPGIVSRGFVYIKDNQEMIKEAEMLVYEALKSAMKQKVTFNDLKNCIKNTLEPYLYSKTHRNPIVIPVILNNVEVLKKRKTK